MKRTKPYIYEWLGIWYLRIEEERYACITWQEAVLTFNKIRFERITQK